MGIVGAIAVAAVLLGREASTRGEDRPRGRDVVRVGGSTVLMSEGWMEL